MPKNFICLICGENIAVQIDLNKLVLSTDCKNKHHFREISFNDYYKFLPNTNIKYSNENDEYIFYCFICQKNINLSKIQEHNRHDGIKLSINEFLSKVDCIEFNRNILKCNFDSQLNRIEKIIKDFKEWKNKFDEKFNELIKFLENLSQFEKEIFKDVINRSKNKENYYDYELLINIKEIYRINNEFHLHKREYEGLFNNTNFNKLSYFIMNKLKDIKEKNLITFKDIQIYYKENKSFFNEEIKYKKERNDNLFPLIKKLFKDCKHLVGYDSRYFEDNSEIKNIIKLNNNILQHFLLEIKWKYPKINHLSHMRNKSYFLCSIDKRIIIIKTNLFEALNENSFKMKEINIINSLHYNDLSDIILSIELTNHLLISSSENYIYIYESYQNEEAIDEDDFYKNYFLKKKIKSKNKIEDMIQISSKLFCTYSFISMELVFYDIENTEMITRLGGIEGTPSGNLKYFTMIERNLLLFVGADKIFIISTLDMEIKYEIRTSGLVSSFCLLPNKGLLCGEIIIDYTPSNIWKKGDNKFNLVQYQIYENQKIIKKISEKEGAHKDIIRSLHYLENNIILSCSTNGELKLWY